MSDSHGDVGSFVAHALGHDERRAYEMHAHDCPTCRLEQQEFDETLAELALLAQTPPPAELRADLLDAVRRIRPLPPTLQRATEVLERTSARPQPRETEAATVIPLRRRRIVPMLASLVAAVMVIALSLGVWVHTLGEQHRSDIAASTAESQLFSAPDAKIYAATLQGRPVSYVVSMERNQALIIGDGLPDPGVGRTYQLWRITDAGAIPAGLVGNGGMIHGWFTGPLSGVRQLAVTIEHSGGAQQPTPPIRSAVQL